MKIVVSKDYYNGFLGIGLEKTIKKVKFLK